MISSAPSVSREPAAAIAAALVCVAALVYLMYVHYERPVAEAYRRSEWLYAQTAANEQIVAHAAQLKRLHARALANLRRISMETSLSVSTANVILDLQTSAQQFGITILSIEPGAQAQTAALPVAPSPVKPHTGLSQTPLTVRARGTFHPLLHFISALSKQRTLLSVNDTSFALAATAGKAHAAPLLDATIHATLYRLSERELESLP